MTVGNTKLAFLPSRRSVIRHLLSWWVILFLFTASLLSAQSPLAPMPRALPDSLRADSLAARRAVVSREDTTLIIKHHFNHRQQIITGSIIMACAAVMVVVMNNYNPQGLEQ